jgi:DNA-binding XRE family transcriptional regulator
MVSISDIVTPALSFILKGNIEMNHDLIHVQGKPYALVPLHEYRVLVSGSDAASNDDLPDDILDQLIARNENPIRILRKFRGLTQAELAEASGLSRPYLTEIERGSKEGSIGAFRGIAAALHVNPGLLLN